jgi:hypothetical protein
LADEEANGEVNDIVEEMLDKAMNRWRDEMVIPVEAEKIVKKLRREQPAVLVLWLDQHAERLISSALSSRLRNYRHDLRKSAGPRAFEKWRSDAIKNKQADPALLAMPYAVNATGAWKKLGDMTKDDLDFVIGQREKSAAELQLEARFLRQLAQRLEKGQTVSERWGVEELARIADAA